MIGIDLVKLPRIQASMERFGEKFLHRFLSPEEILLIKGPKTAAGFWAAKEAASKALGTGIGTECGFHQIHIGKTSKGAPTITLDESLLAQFSIESMALSITHDGEYAIAVVAIQKTLSSMQD